MGFSLNDSYSIELSSAFYWVKNLRWAQVFQDSAVALPPLNPNLARKMLQEGPGLVRMQRLGPRVQVSTDIARWLKWRGMENWEVVKYITWTLRQFIYFCTCFSFKAMDFFLHSRFNLRGNQTLQGSVGRAWDGKRRYGSIDSDHGALFCAHLGFAWDQGPREVWWWWSWCQGVVVKVGTSLLWKKPPKVFPIFV